MVKKREREIETILKLTEIKTIIILSSTAAAQKWENKTKRNENESWKKLYTIRRNAN